MSERNERALEAEAAAVEAEGPGRDADGLDLDDEAEGRVSDDETEGRVLHDETEGRVLDDEADVSGLADRADASAEAERDDDEDDEDDEDDDAPRFAEAPAAAWADARVRAAVEALLFASPDVLPLKALRRILPEPQVATPQIRAALQALAERYAADGSGIVLNQVAGGWQLQTREEHFELVQALARTRSEEKVTQAALETLAIVAYKQPITRAEIDAIRGVGSGQIIRTLMDKKMVKVVGRVDLPGRPFQYGTTRQFLEQFALASLDDLPKGRDL